MQIIEALAQVIFGTILIFVSNLIFFPLLGIESTMTANATMVGINTVIAFLKSYGVRAFFKRIQSK
jgi:hypothetical protein